MRKILIIDDDEQLRSLLRFQLEREKYCVLEAVNGESGLEAARKNTPDLVISDLIMPKKDGIMTIQELLVEFPAMPVIAISGGPNGNSSWLPIAKRAGAMQVMKKPFSRDDLLRAVKRVFDDSWKSSVV